MIAVIADINAQPGTQREVGDVLRSLVAPSRSHAGCVQYQVHTDPDDDHHFAFYEQWQSRAHLADHLAEPEFAALTESFITLEPAIDMRVLDVEE